MPKYKSERQAVNTNKPNKNKKISFWPWRKQNKLSKVAMTPSENLAVSPSKNSPTSSLYSLFTNLASSEELHKIKTYNIEESYNQPKDLTAKELSAQELFNKVVPLKDEYYDITALKDALTLFVKICHFWDKMKTNLDDQIAYEKIKTVLQEMQAIMEEAVQIPRPAKVEKEYFAYRITIENYMQKIKEAMEQLNSAEFHNMQKKIPLIKGKKSFLLAQFYCEYLVILYSTHLFNKNNDSIPGMDDSRHDAYKLFGLLFDELKNSEYATKNLITVEEAANAVYVYEERIAHQYEEKFAKDFNKLYEKLNNQKEKKRESILGKIKKTFNPFGNKRKQEKKIEEALEKLQTLSLEFLKRVMRCPDDYRPVSNAKEKNELIEDLIYSQCPAEYVLISQYCPEAMERLYKSFVFSNEDINDYFDKKNFSNSQNVRLNKDVLIMKIDKELHPEFYEEKANDHYFPDDLSELSDQTNNNDFVTEHFPKEITSESSSEIKDNKRNYRKS